MKLKFDVLRNQPDPFIFEDGGNYYLYVTAYDGVEAYSAEDVFGVWHFEGTVAKIDGRRDYWAPSVIKLDGRYYIYFSCRGDEGVEQMHVMSASSPLGPFEAPKRLYDYFSIDSHVVKTEAGLFLWFSRNGTEGERIGTRVCVDSLLDPYTPSYRVRDVVFATLDEERFTPDYKKEWPWHTVEGAFWLRDGDYQYVMYSGGCYRDDTYHVGYAYARSDESDLTLVDFKKCEDGKNFSPVIIKNEFEEGTGHHSVIKLDGQYYAIYHARDYKDSEDPAYVERRTARICKLHIKDGKICAERYEDRV